MPRPRALRLGRLAQWGALAAFFAAGCSGDPGGCVDRVDLTYGRAGGESINGTGTFAQLLRDRGHMVRSGSRYPKKPENNVIVRFAYSAAPPPDEETDWLRNWLMEDYGRSLVYVMNDYSSEKEFWRAVKAALPPNTAPEYVGRVDRKINEAQETIGPFFVPFRGGPGTAPPGPP